MNDGTIEETPSEFAFSFELNEPPDKVWRAISVPELRKVWLPEEPFVEAETISVTPGQEIRYRLREDTPPFLESVVTFRIAPSGNGGTVLRIDHELADPRSGRMMRAAANTNMALSRNAA